MSADVPIVPAATVVLLREGRVAPEVLLLRRNSQLAFHGGAWVFPGAFDRAEVRIDGGEIHDHRWFTAEAALAAQRAKEIASKTAGATTRRSRSSPRRAAG